MAQVFRGRLKAILKARSGRSALAAALLALSATRAEQAAAHQVWIEASPKQAKFCFGEFGDNLKEASPGYLDKLTRPEAVLHTKTGKKSVPLVKGKDGFTFAGAIAPGQSLTVIDAAYPISERKEGDKLVRSSWTPAARYSSDLAAAEPELPLDVVPTGTPGEFKVVFKGQALPNTSVSLTLESGWSREATTDAQGKVSFPLPWKSVYALLVRHKHDKPGSRPSPKGEERYDVASFGTTLSFATHTGLPAPPAPPPAPPNKP